MNAGGRLELEYVEPVRNARRFYAMSAVGLVLVVQRGRIGSPLVTIRTRFADRAALDRKWRALERLRRRHGYRERETRQLSFPFMVR